MNPTYKQMWNEIIKHNKITICTHINPDGDTIGSAYALKYLINEYDPNIEIKISGEKAPLSLKTVNEVEKVSDDFFNHSQVIVVDTNTSKRISDKRVVPRESLNIDHHHDETEFKMRIGGDHWPATGEVIYEMIKELDLKTNHNVDRGLFYAIWTDTEGMTQRNISDVTRKAIEELSVNGIKEECIDALMLPHESQKIINDIKSYVKVKNNISYVVRDIKVPEDYYRPIIAKLSNEAITEVFVSILRNEKNQIRGSLRSKGNIDVSKYAKEFGGGGHFASSGFRCKSFREGEENIKKLIEKMM